MYGEPISLRYKNNKMFYTNYGAFASIFVYFLVIQYMVGLLIQVLSKDVNLITSQQANEFEKFDTVNITHDNLEVHLSESQIQDLENYRFFMGYRLINATTGQTIEDDETVAYVRIDHITSYYEKNTK